MPQLKDVILLLKGSSANIDAMETYLNTVHDGVAFPFLSGLKKPCVRTFPDARLLIFFSMFLCLFLMYSRVLRMARIF